MVRRNESYLWIVMRRTRGSNVAGDKVPVNLGVAAIGGAVPILIVVPTEAAFGERLLGCR